MSTYCVTCVWWLKLFHIPEIPSTCYCCRGTRVVEWNIEDVNLVTWNMKKEYFSELILFTFIHSLTHSYTYETCWDVMTAHFIFPLHKIHSVYGGKTFFHSYFLWISSYRWKRDRVHTMTTKRCWQKRIIRELKCNEKVSKLMKITKAILLLKWKSATFESGQRAKDAL